ncbi:MAG: Hsp20/alpha crystallin family protein [Planctomycetes bacterium]|nr:Hsp20/alpha crystallin family protein [Planctomycetota bacterium]
MDCLIPFRRRTARTAPAAPSARPADLFDRMFSDFFGDGFAVAPLARDGDTFAPALDVHDDESQYVVRVELPGIDAKDVTLELDGDLLVLSGTKQDEKSGKEGGTRWTERRFGAFRRALELPGPVVAEGVKASADKGVLTITLPKAKPSSGRKIPVETR